MAASLSADEFQRLQDQLIELKNRNYELEERWKRHQADVVVLEHKNKSLEDSLQKASTSSGSTPKLAFQSLLRGKHAKNTTDTGDPGLESVRQKVAQQEEEFRLQNSTLLEECQRLVIVNDDLQRKLELYREVDTAAEQSTLVSSLNEQIKRLNDEIQSLKAQVGSCESQHAAQRENSPSHLYDSACSPATPAEYVSASASGFDLRDSESQTKFITTACSATSTAEQPGEASAELKEVVDRLTLELKNVKANEIVLQHQLNSANKQLKDDTTKLNETIRRLNERNDDLIKAKESQFQDFRKSLDETTAKKDMQITQLHGDVALLKQKLESRLQEMQTVQEDASLWTTERASYESRIAELRGQLAEAKDQTEAFHIQIQETHSANDCLSAQLQEARSDVEKMQAVVDNAQEVAEKRKSLLDDMASHLDKLKEENKQQLVALENKCCAQINALKAEMEAEREKANEVPKLKAEISKLQNELGSILQRKDDLQQRVKELETQIEVTTIQHEETLQRLQTEADERLITETERLTSDRDTVLGQLNDSKRQLEENILQISQLKQDLKDRSHDVGVIEKKHVALLKDLKRQVQSEKKRADRLQEKLQEIALANSAASPNSSGLLATPGNGSQRKSPDDQARIMDSSGSDRFLKVGDNSSVSSWSLVYHGNGGHQRDSVERHSNDNDSIASEVTLEQENQDLISKLAELQRTKWELEERVHMLETCNRTLSDDLTNKSAIIEQYVRDKHVNSPTHHGAPAFKENLPPSLKKMFDFVKMDLSASDIREMNKRLQLMLEEALTKNMHLTTDLEMMSQEIQRLSAALIAK